MNKISEQLRIIDMLTNRKAHAAKPSGFETTIDINGYEFDCIVDYEITPECLGGRGDFGMKTEPNEPASISLSCVWIFNNKWDLVDIPELSMTDILDEIMENEKC